MSSSRGVRKPRPRKPPRTVARVVALAAVSTGGDPDLRAAADVIADAARQLAGWSRTVPDSISVRVDGNTATISASAPAARPAELRLNHPLFGDRDRWYGPPGHEFLVPAADLNADAALAKYAKKIDKMAAAAGYR